MFESNSKFDLYSILEKYSFNRDRGMQELKKQMELFDLSIQQKRYAERVAQKFYDFEEEQIMQGHLMKRRKFDILEK